MKTIEVAAAIIRRDGKILAKTIDSVAWLPADVQVIEALKSQGIV